MVKYVLLVSILLTSACAAQKINTNQGIIGEVRWVEGNLMPAIGDTSYVNRVKGIPIQREIYIYELKKMSDQPNTGVFFQKFASGLIKQIETKKDGTFKVALQPGKYSLFVMEEEGLFANRYDGEGYINPVTVEESCFTEITLLVNYRAFY